MQYWVSERHQSYSLLYSPAVRGGQTVSKTVASEANEVGSIPTGAAKL